MWEAVLLVVLLLYGGMVFYFRFKPLPPGIDYEGPEHRVPDEAARFIFDLTWWEGGKRRIDHQILAAVCAMVRRARSFVVIDMFLFNVNKAQERPLLPTTRDLVDTLLEAKAERPGLRIFFITDPINNFYGSYEAGPLARLRRGGVDVIITDTDRLRDRNYLYAGFWRLFFQWFGTRGRGWIPDPIRGGGKLVTLRALLKALNARANHRKLVIADVDGRLQALVTSANMHEASSWLSNIGFVVDHPGVAADCLKTERAVARISEADLPVYAPASGERESGELGCRVITEASIGEMLLKDIDRAGAGDEVRVAMLFLSDQAVIRSLSAAALRGAEVSVFLDQNVQSFGMKKTGLPNQVTAFQIIRQSRGAARCYWWRSIEEEFHPKLAAIARGDRVVIFGGSANLTHRNIAGFTLETMLRFDAPRGSGLARDVLGFFERIKDPLYSIPAERPAGGQWWKRALFTLQQITGATTY